MLAAWTVSAQTNQTESCCRHPVRVFGDNTTVNLTPLFHWWTHGNHSGQASASRNGGLDPSRPLPAWHRITGTKTGDLDYSWIVDAVIYTSPSTRTNARIILKNPPATEEQLFNNLKSQLAAAGRQITNDQRTYQADLKAAQKAESRVQAESRSTNRRTRNNRESYSQQAAQKNATATAALTEQKQLEQTRALAEQQFNAIPAMKGKYQLDWFAMKLGRNKDGVPIYDVGIVEASSP